MKEMMLGSLLATILLAVTSPGQTVAVASPAEPGMYIEVSGGLTKVIGQIAEFKRSGSLFVSDITVGIKTKKQNIQLLGPHAQNVVSAQPVFYFMPAKQEAEAGVNAGDLILIRLEEKPKRRQFEIAARGQWRSGHFSYAPDSTAPGRSDSWCLPDHASNGVKPGRIRFVPGTWRRHGSICL